MKDALKGLQRLVDPLPRRVAVFRALQLGDLLCTIPALRALRTALPGARITLLGLPWARSFVERFHHYVDFFLEFPGYPGLPERPAQIHQLPEFMAAVQREEFDLLIQMHGSGTITNPLVACFGARRVAGFYLPGHFCPDADHFLPYPERVPEVWRHLRLMEFLGVKPQGEHLEFPVHPADRRALRALPGAEALRPGTYVCVHPGARAASRRWPAERFGAVADRLAAKGLRVVLTGTREEKPLTAAVAGAMGRQPIDLVGRTDLGSLAALLEGARLLLCNDTGVSHLAAALRVPSVVVFHGMADVEGWPPLDRVRHRVVCRVTTVTPADVLDQAEDLLRRTDSTPNHEEPTHASFASADLAHSR